MNKKDRKILDILVKGARKSTKDIANETGMPISTVYDRMKKLEEDGIIEGYRAVINPRKLGKEITAFVSLTVTYHLPSGKKVLQRDLAERISKFPCVEEVHIVAGGDDIILKVRTESVARLNKFIIEDLRTIEGVDKTQTEIVLDSVKDVY